jgi:hypothetical protein
MAWHLLMASRILFSLNRRSWSKKLGTDRGCSCLANWLFFALWSVENAEQRLPSSNYFFSPCLLGLCDFLTRFLFNQTWNTAVHCFLVILIKLWFAAHRLPAFPFSLRSTSFEVATIHFIGFRAMLSEVFWPFLDVFDIFYLSVSYC